MFSNLCISLVGTFSGYTHKDIGGIITCLFFFICFICFNIKKNEKKKHLKKNIAHGGTYSKSGTQAAMVICGSGAEREKVRKKAAKGKGNVICVTASW